MTLRKNRVKSSKLRESEIGVHTEDLTSSKDDEEWQDEDDDSTESSEDEANQSLLGVKKTKSGTWVSVTPRWYTFFLSIVPNICMKSLHRSTSGG